MWVRLRSARQGNFYTAQQRCSPARGTVTATDAETSEDMANEQRTANIWMTLVTILWVALGLGVVVLILWWGGIIGGGNGNGTETTVSETSGDNGADSDQSDDGGGAAAGDNGDAVRS